MCWQEELASEAVEPGLLGSVMLDAVQVLLAVVHVVLKGAVTVVAIIPLPHVCPAILLNTADHKHLTCHTLALDAKTAKLYFAFHGVQIPPVMTTTHLHLQHLM